METMLLCEKIRAKRLEAGFKLAEVAKRTGYSQSYLSQIERGLIAPSVAALQKIAAALDLSTAFFFESGEQEKTKNNSVDIVRKNERKGLMYPGSNIGYQLLSPDLQGKIEFLYITAPPGSCTGEEVFVHEGQEYGVILQGTMELWIGDTPHILNAGDSIVFDCSSPHRWRNCGDVELIAIWAVTPPSF